MKKILVVIVALCFLNSNSFAQDPEVRPAAIGVSFFFNDYLTPSRIRSQSLTKVLADKQWAKTKEMSPGLAVSYFQGFSKHVDFAGTLAGSFVKDALGNGRVLNNQFLLEADASFNLKMVSEKYLVQPYLIAGVGASMYKGSYFGAFIPTGVGMRLNIMDDAALFVTSQYRIPVTKETSNYHLFYQFGVAGRIGKKAEPVVLKPLPPAPPLDTDKDGIIDSLDKCPTVPGLEKYNGCPIPDTDKDGVNDEEDKCPTVPGLAKYQGCPVPDTDKDGINDEEDKCPTVAGVARYQGCPVPDTDGDGVNDEDDRCPSEAGLAENFGCPTLEQFKFNAKKVQFVSGSATLTAAAKVELDKGAVIMSEHPDLKISIEGHTDNTGKEDKNQALSEKRAEAVKAYFVKKGINADRLVTIGYGQSTPIADNKTVQGRAANRRVEFKAAR
ncbi:OmpA family protein [Terrimonas sp. NA20]|uniref:OmpA family protein n=1 Tax=Terrimonas ginsenosidimutans TaxID=2908004 RepID=A0ABS9KTB6_9BACT|nr:OmpA family protein [Terrimonas ginsenosidimutans]MCG2615577.1 OmpA family protein [Terrimonas ginsenosidimutans]